MLPGGVLRGNPKTSIYERIVDTPSISIVNMNSGKPNGGNSIQDSAICTIGIRVTAGQDPDRIGKVVKKHLESQVVPGNLPMKVTVNDKCRAWKADLTRPFSKKYLEALGENFKDKCAAPCGGALPLLYDFKEAFAKKGFSVIDMIVPGIEDSDTNAHSHNESQSKELLRNSINTLISFMGKAASIKVVHPQ